MNEEMLADIANRVSKYKNYREYGMTEMMVREVKYQYIDMAKGGDGSCVGNGEIRNAYYPDMPDEFFMAICNRMGWND